MSSIWSSSIGKFPKKDPKHGQLWEKIKCWLGMKKCCGKPGTCKSRDK